MVVLLSATAGFARAQHGEGPPPEQVLIEQAKRELQELPNTGRTALPQERRFDSAITVPTLTPGAARNSTSRQSATPAREPDLQADDPSPSRGWLLDALDKREWERTRGSPRGGREGEEQRQSDYEQHRRSPRKNPLNDHLETWLSPRDRALLLPRTRQELSNGRRDPAASWERSTAAPVGGMSHGDTPGFGTPPAKSRNPYLEEPNATGSFLTESLAPAPTTRVGPAAQPLVPVALPTLSNKRGLGTPLPTAQPKGDNPAPPAAPLLDERRYFPQLKRF